MKADFQEELGALMRLPWGLRVRKLEDGSFAASIDELPEYVAAGDSEAELENAVWDSLASLLQAYLSSGDHIPRPRGSLADLRVVRPPVWRPSGGSATTPPFGTTLVDA